MLSLEQIKALALSDPWAALAYLASPSKQPGAYATVATFTDVTEGVSVEVSSRTPTCDEFFVRDFVYQVRSPTANSDNLLFKGQQDVYNAGNPNIDVTVEVIGSCPSFLIGDGPLPIETICERAPSGAAFSWVGGWIAPRKTILSCSFLNRRAFAALEVPVEVWLVMRGWNLACGGVLSMSAPEVLKTLEDVYGIAHPFRGKIADDARALGNPYVKTR